MAVTLNANTSTGFIATSDTSGVLQLQTGGTTALTVDASQNVTLANGTTIQGLTVGLGAGAVSTNTAVGASALAANTSGANNTAVGQVALDANTTGSLNVAFGVNTLGLNTTGSENSAIGVSSLSANTTGSYNTALGRSALGANTTASENTAVGYQAEYTNTTGGSNTATGYQALYTNSIGSYNTATGWRSIYLSTTASYNTAYGYASLYSNTTGAYNVALGMQSLNSNTTASYNTAVGYQAGYSQTTAPGNSCFGYKAGYAQTTGGTYGSNTFIGSEAGLASTGDINTFVGAGSGYLVTSGARNTILGAYSGNQGGLDIRTASNYIVLSDGNGNPRAYWPGNSQMFLPANGAIRMESDGGRIYLASVTSNSQFQISYNSVSAGVALGSGATSWSTFSDERLKNVTGTYTNALEDIAQIQPVKFTWKNDTENKPQVGVIAQSVQNVVPEAMDSTTYEMDGDAEYLQVRYTELIPLMIASIKELNAKVDAQAAEIAALKGQA